MVINKSKSAFRTIAEVAEKLGVGTHVLRFWESKFSQLKPIKMSGGRRYYRPDDVKLLECIQHLLYEERYTIEGVQKLFREKGTKYFVGDTIQEDFFLQEEEQPLPEVSSDTKQIPADTGISTEKLNSIISELKNIKQELQKNAF